MVLACIMCYDLSSYKKAAFEFLGEALCLAKKLPIPPIQRTPISRHVSLATPSHAFACTTLYPQFMGNHIQAASPLLPTCSSPEMISKPIDLLLPGLTLDF